MSTSFPDHDGHSAMLALQPYVMWADLIYLPVYCGKGDWYQHAVKNYRGVTYIIGLTLRDRKSGLKGAPGNNAHSRSLWSYVRLLSPQTKSGPSQAVLRFAGLAAMQHLNKVLSKNHSLRPPP